MQIIMKETTKGSPNGIQVNLYEKDQEYDLPESLVKTFLKMGVAKMVTVHENKDAGSAPQNKDAGSAPDNKDGEKEKKEKKVRGN